MLIQRQQPVMMGNLFTDLTAGITGGISSFMAPKEGRVIAVPGAPAPLSMAIVVTLAGAVVLIAVMKKKGAL
jgi:MFS superfamily sulfate permease-like transporter